MNDTEILINMFKFFAKFVPKPVLKKMFVKPDNQIAGYAEVAAEVLAAPDDCVIEHIDSYIFSANEAFLSKKIKNSHKTVLYIEYGAFSYQPNTMLGVKEKLGIHVAQPYSASNNDNLNEMLIMDKMYKTLTAILDQMEKDQSALDFCGHTKLIEFPAEVVAIDPRLFYDRAGWMAIFDHSVTSLV